MTILDKKNEEEKPLSEDKIKGHKPKLKEKEEQKRAEEERIAKTSKTRANGKVMHEERRKQSAGWVAMRSSTRPQYRHSSATHDPCPFCRKEKAMFQCFNLSMFQCFHVSMHQCLNVSMPQCFNTSLLRCFNASMIQCFKASMLQFFNASILHCYDASILKLQFN